jgi:nitrogen-specific signal transduction histidine kinase
VRANFAIHRVIQQRQIFEPFFTTKLRRERIWLYLSIVKKFTEQQDNIIKVSSALEHMTFLSGICFLKLSIVAKTCNAQGKTSKKNNE